MTNAIARWVRAKFAVVPDVSRASLDPDPSVIFKTHQADIVVATWMGARLYVYLVAKPLKVRDVKNLLRTNSRSGIGTLFIVDKNILPESGSQVKLVDWWESLVSLHDNFFYTYFMEDDELKVTQVHFTPINGKELYHLWYLPDFEIEKVTVRRREINNGNVKGRWHLGDIASPDYKRRVGDERANQRFHYRTKYTQDVPNDKSAKGNGQGSNRVHDLRLQKYYALIGVEKDASEQDIKTAFRQMALKVHPDVSALPRQEATRRIKELNEAYEYIKNFHGWA